MKNRKSLILYVVFGVMTTLINVVVYLLCYKILRISNIWSTSFAWLLSVLFAFFTNKVYVFESRDFALAQVRNEAIQFIASRLSTGFFDVVIMYVFVDIMHFSAVLMKIVANAIVIALNYILGKVIFKS